MGHTSIPTDPAGSSDPAIQQMGSAIKIALDELLTIMDWQDLTVRATISVVGDNPSQIEKGFALPSDFERFIDQSQWAGTQQLPAGGPITNMDWMAYVIQTASLKLSLYWQMRGDQIFFLTPPFPTPSAFNYMYVSRAQVIASNGTDFKNYPTANSDTFKLASNLVMLLGRAKYLELKGFDATGATRDYITALDSKISGNKGAQVLSLARRRVIPLLNPASNLPNTGFGT